MHSIFPGYSLAQGNKTEEKNFLAVTAKSSFYRKGQKLIIYFWKAKEQLSLEEITNKGCQFRFSLQWCFLISALKVFSLHIRTPENSIPCGMLSKVPGAAQSPTIKLQVSKSNGKLCIHAETLAGVSDNLIAVSLCCVYTKHKPSKGSS